MALPRYASDDTVRLLQNSVARGADYIFTLDEAEEKFCDIAKECDWIVNALRQILAVSCEIVFAVSASRQPFQVTLVSAELAVILVDSGAVYALFGLCMRVPTLSTVAEAVHLNQVSVETVHKGSCLLDIVNYFMFNPPSEVDPLFQTKDVYIAAIIFGIGHEIAHVTHGHLEFLNSADAIDLLCDDEEKRLTHRTLEMDADSSGTTCVTDIFEQILGRIAEEKQDTGGKSLEDVRSIIQHRYVLGIFIAMLYMDARSTNATPAKHPIGYARFLTVFGVLQRVLAERFGPEAAEIPEVVRRALSEAFILLSGGIQHLGHPMVSNMMVRESGSEEYKYVYHEMGVAAASRAHLEPLHRRWARLHPFLLKYRKGGGLAPPTAPPI
jgi:hypothetical protein